MKLNAMTKSLEIHSPNHLLTVSYILIRDEFNSVRKYTEITQIKLFIQILNTDFMNLK